MLWWFPCPSGPMHAIPADTDGILMHTCIYMHILTIPTYTYVYMHIYAYTYTYMHIPDTPNLKRPYLGNQ